MIKRNVPGMGEMDFESQAHFERFMEMRKGGVGRPTILSVNEKGHVTAPRSAGNGLQDEREARQSMRRHKILEGEVQALVNRGVAGPTTQVEYIAFEKWAELQRDFQAAMQAGETPQQAAKRVGYEPLPSYIHKIQPPGKKPIRRVLQHEVGVRPNGVIICLEEKVPGDVGAVVVGPHTFKKNPAPKAG